MPLNVRSERLWGLCAKRPAAGLRHRWVAAGTGLCHQLPTRTEDAWHSWIFHSQGASPSPSHGHHGREGMARPRDATPGWGHKRSPPQDPSHPTGSAGRWAQPEGEEEMAVKMVHCCCQPFGAVVLPIADRAGLSVLRGAGAHSTASSAPRAPSPSCCTKNQHWLTWFQPVFLHD